MNARNDINPLEVFAFLSGESGLSAEPLDGGFTNRSYLIAAKSGRYVLRIPGERTNEYIDRGSEMSNMRQLSFLKCMPEVICSDVESGLLLTRYIDCSRPICVADLDDERILDLACETMSAVHGCGEELGSAFDYAQTIESYKGYMEREGSSLPEEVLDAEPTLMETLGCLYSDYPKDHVPCHGDPKLNNFLMRGNQIFLIDWEYSGMADRCFDLVSLVMTNNLTGEREAAFLTAYEKASGLRIDRRRYLLSKVATDYMWLFWHLIKLYQGEMVEYNAKSWRDRLNRALFNIKIMEDFSCLRASS